MSYNQNMFINNINRALDNNNERNAINLIIDYFIEFGKDLCASQRNNITNRDLENSIFNEAQYLANDIRMQIEWVESIVNHNFDVIMSEILNVNRRNNGFSNTTINGQNSGSIIRRTTNNNNNGGVIPSGINSNLARYGKVVNDVNIQEQQNQVSQRNQERVGMSRNNNMSNTINNEPVSNLKITKEFQVIKKLEENAKIFTIDLQLCDPGVVIKIDNNGNQVECGESLDNMKYLEIFLNDGNPDTDIRLANDGEYMVEKELEIDSISEISEQDEVSEILANVMTTYTIPYGFGIADIKIKDDEIKSKIENIESIQTRDTVKKLHEKLKAKYKEFIDDKENTRITNNNNKQIVRTKGKLKIKHLKINNIKLFNTLEKFQTGSYLTLNKYSYESFYELINNVMNDNLYMYVSIYNNNDVIKLVVTKNQNNKFGIFIR